MLGARWVLVEGDGAQASVGSVEGHTTDPLGQGRREALFLEAQNTHIHAGSLQWSWHSSHGLSKNESTHNYNQAHTRPQKHRRHSGITALRVLPPPTEAFKVDLLITWTRGGIDVPGGTAKTGMKEPAEAGPFRRRGEKRTSASRNTSPVWCAACAGSPPHARAPSASAGSGPPPSGTTRGATAASRNASGFLQRNIFVLKAKPRLCEHGW